MANKTIYIPDDQVEIFDKCKEIAGKSLSSVILNALKLYLMQKDIEEKNMKEHDLWVGVEALNDFTNEDRGKRIKFVGKELSTYTYEDCTNTYDMKLYKTRKNKYLLYSVSLDKPKAECISTYSIYDDFKSLYKLGLPRELLSNAEKLMPDITYEVLDI